MEEADAQAQPHGLGKRGAGAQSWEGSQSQGSRGNQDALRQGGSEGMGICP